MIRVLLADDHEIVRAGLKRIVQEAGDMEVVAEAPDGRQALKLIEETSPDVAVVDISMPGMDGLEVIDRLHGCHPKLPVLVLTMHEEDQYVVRTINLGAKGYLTKRSAPEQLVKAIRQVHNGGFYLADQAAESLAGSLSRGSRGETSLETLTTRELQVLRGLALGMTNREIASSYGISVKTVDTHRSRLLKKLNLRNNAELARFALQNRLIET
mgnify:CR=1 FL=1